MNDTPRTNDTNSIMRYQIYKGSQSSHCCFDATVVDTTKPDIIGGEHYKGSDGQYHYDIVCECFSIEDAEKIRDALNSLENATVEARP
jgi:hypothetical protein